jgi:hypothetical protein
MANITGWGRGTWDEGAFGEPIPVTLTGLAATSALGTLTVDAEANVTLTSLVGQPLYRVKPIYSPWKLTLGVVL